MKNAEEQGQEVGGEKVRLAHMLSGGLRREDKKEGDVHLARWCSTSLHGALASGMALAQPSLWILDSCSW